MTAPSLPAGFRPIRRDQLRQEREHDSYKSAQKPAGPVVCPGCAAVFHAGRWQWGERPEGAAELLCPTCHRVRDSFPSGFVHVGGTFFAAHRDELLSLLRHHEEKARAEHPQARIMAIDDEADGVLVTTADIHLARDLGDALLHAYHGKLDFHYNEGERLLRVHWRR